MESAGIDVSVIEPSVANVIYKDEVDLASYAHDGQLNFGPTALSAEEVVQRQESALTNRVFYSDGGLREGRGAEAFLEAWVGGAHSHKEVIWGLCSSYRAERRAII